MGSVAKGVVRRTVDNAPILRGAINAGNLLDERAVLTSSLDRSLRSLPEAVKPSRACLHEPSSKP